MTFKFVEKETEKRDQSIVKFSNDLFFKYMLCQGSPTSISLLMQFIKLVTGINCVKVEVKNPSITVDHVNTKGITLDILVYDDKNRIFNLEMQMYGTTASQVKRMQYYIAKIINEQLEQGAKYYNLEKVTQCVFFNLDSPNDDLVDIYEYKNQYNEVIPDSLFSSYFVYMEKINKILKEKSLDELSDLERLCYLFINNDYNGIIKEEDDDIIRRVVTMYDKFTSDDEMWELGRMRESALNLEESHKMEFLDKGIEIGHDKGLKEGIEKGTLKTLISSCNKAINKLFHVDCLTWLETLNKQQLEQVYDLVFEVNDFNQLKEKIK